MRDRVRADLTDQWRLQLNPPVAALSHEIDTAILQLEKHVTVSRGNRSLSGSGASSQPGSLPPSLPESHTNSGYNTPQGLAAGTVCKMPWSR